jgi:hypothetical protein
MLIISYDNISSFNFNIKEISHEKKLEIDEKKNHDNIFLSIQES